MEMKPAVSVRVLLEEQSQVAEARRMARNRAEELGFDETLGEQVAIVVTEAATNILKHAGRGEILINAIFRENGRVDGCLEILALDRGTGIRNLDQCLQDGYSTASSPGQGLGAIFRLSTFADIYTSAGKGTAVVARWGPTADGYPAVASSLTIGAVNASKPGQALCGD